ncbi:MAG: addiction module protein [Deltaproteobacteria bacterium]
MRSAVVVQAALALGAGVLAFQPGEARACSCAAPFQNELRVGDGRIPSNAALSDEERATLADRLLEIVPEVPDAAVEEAWLKETVRRRAE